MKNILKPFSKPLLLVLFFILLTVTSLLWWHFTDITIMLGNYGKGHTYFDIGLSMIMVIWFPLFLIGILYKGMLFGARENLDGKTGIGAVSGIIGTILSGCSCCGLTLASYFGLLPLMGFLPYSGLEIKTLGALGLLYAIWATYANLEVCRVKNR